jgi:hypothetical protein
VSTDNEDTIAQFVGRNSTETDGFGFSGFASNSSTSCRISPKSPLAKLPGTTASLSFSPLYYGDLSFLPVQSLFGTVIDGWNSLETEQKRNSHRDLILRCERVIEPFHLIVVPTTRRHLEVPGISGANMLAGTRNRIERGRFMCQGNYL